MKRPTLQSRYNERYDELIGAMKDIGYKFNKSDIMRGIFEGSVSIHDEMKKRDDVPREIKERINHPSYLLNIMEAELEDLYVTCAELLKEVPKGAIPSVDFKNHPIKPGYVEYKTKRNFIDLAIEQMEFEAQYQEQNKV